MSVDASVVRAIGKSYRVETRLCTPDVYLEPLPSAFDKFADAVDFKNGRDTLLRGHLGWRE